MSGREDEVNNVVRSFKYVVPVLLLLLILIGCSGMNRAHESEAVVPKHVNYIPKNPNPIPISNKDSMYVSYQLQRAVENVDVVEKAQVIVLNQEAYVAVWTGISKGKGETGEGEQDSIGEALREGIDRALDGNKGSGVNEDQMDVSYEKLIQNIVFDEAPSLQSVHVSFNPDVYRRMKAFADVIKANGHNDSLSGDFEVMVNEYFDK